MGGTQFNGLALVKELVRQGHDVTVCNRGKTDVVLPRSVKRVYGDRTDHEGMKALFRDSEYDCVQDMSAYHPEDVHLMFEIFHGKVGHYIFASSTTIYAASDVLPIDEGMPDDRSDKQNEYGTHKLLCEDCLVRKYREVGFPTSTVPLSMVFGPQNALLDREQRMFVRMMQGRKVLIPGSGTTLGQVGHVDDQARALCQMMGKPITFGKRYNLTGKQTYTDKGYVDVFASVLGLDVERVFIPEALMDALWENEIDLTEAASSAGINIRSSDSGRQRADATRRKYQLTMLIQKIAPNIFRWNQSAVFGIDRLRRDVGWEPEYTFPSMVEQTYEWFMREGLDKVRTYDFTFEDQILDLVARHR